MCSLCAALGGSRYWTDRAGREEFGVDGKNVSLMHERRQRVAALNTVLKPNGVTVSDWGGSSYVLSRSDGVSRNALNLMEIWEVLDELLTPALDPLNPAVIRHLEGISAP